jgi:predicted N-acetyltransferase YhbS
MKDHRNDARGRNNNRVRYSNLLTFVLVGCISTSRSGIHSFGTAAFSPPCLGLGALVNPVRGLTIQPISKKADNRIEALMEASLFFVDAFWTDKVGGGTRTLTERQTMSLQKSQLAEFTNRYGGGGSSWRRSSAVSATSSSTLVVARNAASVIVACAGVQLDPIPKGCLEGPTEKIAPLMSNLAVSRNYRRRGLAGKIVSAVEEVVRKEWGYDECYLYVEERNRGAVRLYQKLGYRRIWTDIDAKTLLPTTDGALLAAGTVIVCMKKKLGPPSLWNIVF